jgi:hypothetical protein
MAASMTGKKLSLSKETLRNLQPVELRRVGGGGGWPCVTPHISTSTLFFFDICSGNTVYEPIATVTCSGATGAP